jgi:hypothetical protein
LTASGSTVLHLQELEQALQALDRIRVHGALTAAVVPHEIVEVETALHVLELTFEFTADVFQRDRRNRYRPLFGEIIRLGALQLVPAQRV